MFRKILAIGILLAAHAVPAFAQAASPVVVTGTPTLTDGQAYPLTLDATGRLKAAITGTVTSTGSGTFTVQSQTTGSNTTGTKATATVAASGSLTVGSANSPMYGFEVVSGASAGFIMVLQGTSLPADGAVTPFECYSIAANSTFVRDYGTFPMRPFSATDTQFIVFSTTGCFSKTISATAFISYRF